MAPPYDTTESEEMALKYIWLLESEDGGPAKTGELSHYLKVAPSSVTGMLGKLQKRGLAKYEKYQGASLTPKGEEVAVSILQRHCVMEWFLVQVLGVPEGTFHEEACRMEHVLSEGTARRLRALTDQPDTCPSCYDLERLHCRYLPVPAEAAVPEAP